MTVEVGNTVLVGLGEMFITHGGERLLVARCLGSSAAVAIHCSQTGVGGLLHWMLPTSEIDRSRAQRNPCLFVDTGLPRLIDEAVRQGARRTSLAACLAGAATLPEGGSFDVGNRNRKEALRLLAEHGLALHKEETGGTAVREMSLEIGPGEFQVRQLLL